MPNLKITVSEAKTTNDFVLRDILGDEFKNYYDGSGYNVESKQHQFFFTNVPDQLAYLAAQRLKNHANLQLSHF